MNAKGYMVEVDYDGDTLTATGTTKASRIALAGQDHAAGPVVIPRADIARVEYKGANPVVNGKVVVHTTDGRKVLLHFRRKQQAAFSELATALGATAS